MRPTQLASAKLAWTLSTGGRHKDSRLMANNGSDFTTARLGPIKSDVALTGAAQASASISSCGTIVLLTVFIAMASATASFTPSSENG